MSRKKLVAATHSITQVQGMPASVVVGINLDWLKSNPTYVMDGFVPQQLQTMIACLINEHPNWRFEFEHFPYSGKRMDAACVFVNDEYIGEIGYTAWDRFRIHSPQIERSMERKRYKDTKDFDKAFKLTKTFKRKSYGDHLTSARHAVHSGMSRFQRGKSYQYDSCISDNMDFIKVYLENNWESVLSAAKSVISNSKYEQMENMLAVRHDATVAKNIFGGRGLYVTIHDGKYVMDSKVNNYGEENYVVYDTSDSLPPEIKRKLGLLKLLPEDMMLENVGYRYTETKFFILEGEQQ